MHTTPTTTTMSSREFNQDSSGAKKAAQFGPVFITDRGRPAHVLLSIDQYRLLTGGATNLIDLLAMPRAEELEFEPAPAGQLFRPADFT